jgi:PKD repeat protein
MKKIILLCCSLFAFAVGSNAQKSIGGVPLGISQNMGTHGYTSETLAPLNMTQINQEDLQDDKNGNWPRIAVAQSTNFNLDNSGEWTILPNGDRIWRIKISGPSAQGLMFSFKDFYLPPGAKLYTYSADEQDVLGAFTSSNNPQNGYISVGIIPQPSAIVEYYEPALVSGYGHFEIYEVAQAYRILTPQAADSRDFGDSDPCQVNVNCTPEGSEWQDEKKGVGRILLKDGPNWGWCTGSLVNNTAQDCAPLFLTVHHCGETSSSTDRSQWFFYFNYESSGCSNGTNPVPNAYSPPAGFSYVTGCTQLSHSNDGGGVNGSDYKLLNLTNLTTTDMVNWGLFLNGWDATDPSSGNIGSTGWNTATGIHHPSGDIKKISSTTGNLITTQWNGSGLPSHWYIQWNATTNGHGVTEGGSSGSPLFNDPDGSGPLNGRLVGTLTGGSSYCNTPTSPDMYGKMSYHWDENTANGGPLGGHLGTFLDPVGGGSTQVLDGTYPPCAPTSPNCAASASATSIVVGGNVNFTDNSTGIPTSWSWDFGDGSPVSTTQNPSHSYTAPGVYTVTLTATNAQGSCTTTLTITVTASTGCDTLNFPPPGTLTVYGDGAGGFLAGTNQYGDLAKAQRFGAYAPYTHVTGGIFYFFTAADGGNGAIARFTIWDEAAGLPNAALATVDIPMANLDPIIPYGGNLIQIFFNSPVNVAGAPYYMGVEMVGFGTGDSLGIVSNTVGDPTLSSQSFEMDGSGTWFDINTNWGGADIDLFISPYMTDLPPTAIPSVAGSTSICEGSTLNFDGSSSMNYDSLEWVFVGGTPNISTNISESVQYNTAGTYTAYLQAYGSCGGYHVDSINNIVVTPSPTVTGTPIDATCNSSDGSITAAGAGGSGGGYQYSIDGGSTFQGSGTFGSLAPGTYTIIVEDANGCQGQATFTVNANNTPITVTGTPTDENCGQADGTITISAPGATQFSINGGINFQGSNSFTGLTAGNYDVVVEDANGCTGATIVTVNGSNNSPTITNTAGTDENCSASDGTITITATGGTGTLQYSIDGTNFQASNTFSGLTAGTYTVYVQDANGCEGTDIITLVNVGGPVVTGVTATDVTCNGAGDGSLTITATTGTGTLTYSVDGVNFFATNTFTGLAPNTYTVYVDNGACVTTDGPHVIGEPTAVTHTATVTDAGCTNNGEIVVVATGGTGSYQYSIDGGTNYQTSGTFSGLAPQAYQVIAMDSDGCLSIVSTETVGSLPALVATAAGADESCSSADGSISISATGGDGNYQYSINGGSSYQSSGTFLGLSANSYNIVVIDNSGCSDAQTVTINNVGGVTVSTNGNQTICDGNTATLIGSGATNYNWFDGTTPIGTGTSLPVSPSVSTIYTLVGDDGTCYDTTTVTVNVNSVPTTTVTADTSICAGDDIVLTAGGGTTYFWTHNGATTASVTETPTSATTYSVVAYNGTCQGSTASVNVTVNPAAVANAGSDVTTAYIGSGGTVNFNNTGSTGVSYSWDFGDSNSSSSASPSHNYTTPGTYTVVLTATLGSCTDTDTLTITVLSGVGVEESEFAAGISVYPNPSNGIVNISFDLDQSRNIELNVMDALGKLVDLKNFNSVYNNTIELDLSSNAKGIYFIKIKSDTDEHTVRITLMK